MKKIANVLTHWPMHYQMTAWRHLIFTSHSNNLLLHPTTV